MIRRLKTLIAAASLLFIMLAPTSFAANQTLNPIGAACNTGNGEAANSSLCRQAGNTSASVNPVNRILHDAANTLGLISAVIAVIMIIISGMSLITAQGNSDAVSTARNRIIYAVVGLLVTAAAWAIVSLLVDHL